MVAGDRPATLQPQEDFPTNRGRPVLQGLDRGRTCSTTRTGCSPRWSGPSPATGPARCGRRPGTRRSTWSPTASRRPAAVRAGRCRRLRRRRPDQREGLHPRQVRQGRAATSAIDYNGRFCMSSSATAGNRAFGVDRGLPFPLSDIADAAAILLVGANPADTMPPAMQYFDAGPGRRRPAHRGGSAAHLDRGRRRHCISRRSPAPTSRWPTGCCTSRSGTGWSTRPTSPSAQRVRGGQGRGGVLLAGLGGADHRRRRRPAPGDRAHPGARRRRR